ncbi:GrpB family protein [Aneurinibacillus migulanus]|uniref:GrpB family protein n=1 Tax=Aneurinibacillus migulanus TaxID=47500 RepID=UPI002E250DAC|nr:GrpB family protein [Aneurinibacillus migulanus]
MSQIIKIENYNPKWESEFCKLQAVIETAMEQLILSIEHVGSTSVKGLGAKLILDIDVVIEDYNVLPNVIKGLEKIGYFHQENWSFEGREAFGRKDILVPWDGKSTIWMEHYLYVCNKDSKELARHLAFRDYLRDHPEAIIEYEQLKKDLAKNAKDRTNYSLGKTNFITKILEKAMKSY